MGNKFQWLYSALLALAVMVVFGYFLFTQDEPVRITIQPPLPTATHTITATPEPIEVYVTGQVEAGALLVSLPYDARVSDAIAAAGGATADADLSRVNLAAFLQDGSQIHVPAFGEVVEAAVIQPTNSASPPGSNPAGALDINTATLEQLDALPGIGPATAQNILDYRAANGAFTSLADLDNVSGIGPATLEELAPLLSFGGASAIAAPAAAVSPTASLQASPISAFTATPPLTATAPATAATATATLAVTSAPPEAGLLNINTATLEELDTLPGIGPVTAQNIIDYRTTNGGFQTLAQLDEVSGIGPATLTDILPLVTLGTDAPAALPTATPIASLPATAIPTETATLPPTATPEPTALPLIDLNTATQEELETLPGIGAASAQNIIAYREANGAFTTLTDLDNVPGIGAATIAEIQPFVTINNAAVSLPTATLPALLNLNTATLEQLDALPGIGPVTAQAIIDYRERRGGFRSINELNYVPGIGWTTFQGIRDYVTVGD